MLRTLVAVLVGIAASACSPELNWREWQSDEAALMQTFPCRPVRQQRKVRVSGQELLLVMQVCDAGQSTWSTAHADAGDPAVVGAVLAGLVNAAQSNLGAVRRPIPARGVPNATPQPAVGRFALQGHAPDGRAMNGSVLVLAKGTVVIQSMVLGERLPGDAVDIFMNSLRLGP